MNDEISVDGAVSPPIAGLAFRHLRDATDYVGMAAVREGSRAWDRIDPRSSREGIPTADDLATIFPLTELREHPDILIATHQGRIIGYSHVRWRWTEITGERVYLHLGYLLPAWRGRGIGSAMLGWSQRRIKQIVAQDNPPGPVSCATNVSSTEREAGALIQGAGYAVVWRLSDMALEPIAVAQPGELPASVERRPLVPASFRMVYDAWKEAYAALWTSTPPTEEDFQEFVGDHFAGSRFDPTLCAVAWSEDQVAGFVLGRIGADTGVIAEVAVRPRWRRRGIARSLMQTVLTSFAERGLAQARLYTDANDGQGARSLYKQLGFRERKQHLLYRKRLESGA